MGTWQGALISSKYIIGPDFLDLGFIHLGLVIIIGSASMLLIFFPGEGGVILPKTFPYNPQLVKETSGQKGSDELDFSKAATKPDVACGAGATGCGRQRYGAAAVWHTHVSWTRVQ